MNRDQHSPAPWVIQTWADYYDQDEDEDLSGILAVVAADGQTVLYTDSGYFKPRSADARLVATAPDLLSALQSVVDYASERAAKRGERPECIDNALAVMHRARY